MERFISRAFQLVVDTATSSDGGSIDEASGRALRRLTHQTIERVTRDLDEFQFNTMVAGLIEFVNELMKHRDQPIAATTEWRNAIETLVLLMAPSTPYVAEELWERLGKPYSVHDQPWPSFDPELAKEDEVEIIVQVNGKVRDRFTASPQLAQSEAVAHATSLPRVQEHLKGQAPAKVVYVPGRLINLVAK
jgi:leucyl-tRNA synthetase